MRRFESVLWLSLSLCIALCGCSGTQTATGSADDVTQWDQVSADLAVAEIRFKHGQHTRVEKNLQRTVQENPTSVRAAYALADFYDIQKAHALSVQVVDAAQKQGLMDPKLLVVKAEALLHLKRFALAKDIYENISLDSSDTPSLSNWALCCFEIGDYKRAAELWSQVYKLEPQNKAALYSLALATSLAGDHTQVQALVSELEKLAPLDAKDLQAHIGLLKSISD